MFNVKANFNDQQLAYAETTQFDRARDHYWHDEKLSKTEHRRIGKPPAPFKKNVLKDIHKEIQKAEAAYETPFD